MDTHVWLEHPETGGTARISAAAAPAWRAMGWRDGNEPPEHDPATTERDAVAAAEAATKSPRPGKTKE